MHIDFSSSNGQGLRASTAVCFVSVTALTLLNGCTQAAGLHEHEAYRGFPDSRSNVLCSNGAQGVLAFRLSCNNDLGPDVEGQDGHLENSKPEYTVEGSDVRDSITGLVWRKRATEAPNYAAAEKECTKLGGDYRLPSRLELISLLDYGGTTVLIDSTVFEDVKPMRYRTSTPYNQWDPQFRDTHWGVNFDGSSPAIEPKDYIPPGEVQQLNDTNEAGVICVRTDSGPYVSGPFEPAGVKNQYLRDTRTGLLWFSAGVAATKWSDAVKKCREATDGDYYYCGMLASF